VLDHIEHVLGAHIEEVFEVLSHLINRHSADGNRRGVDDRLTDAVDVSTSGQIHHGVGPEMDRRVQFLEFAVDVAGDRAVADVGVDLAGGGNSDRHRLEPLGQMDFIGRNDHSAGGDLGTDQLGLEIFTTGDIFHFGGDLPPACGFDLGHDRGAFRKETFTGAGSLKQTTRTFHTGAAKKESVDCSVASVS
jgi:hypothetical protein